MNYGEIFSRALAISWRHKYLWLLALFAGEGAAFSLPNFQSSARGQGSTRFAPPTMSTEQLTAWLSAHAALLWTAGITLAIVVIALFLLSAVMNGALVRASAEHDAERPFGLGAAWSAGVSRFWPVLGLKVFTLVVFAAVAIVIGGLGLIAVAGAFSHNAALAVASGLTAGLLLLVAIPFAIVFQVAVLLGVRAIVLDGKRPLEGLASGFQLIRRRLGRVALVWLLILVAGLVAGVGAGIAVVIVGLPLAGLVAAAYFAGGIPLAVGFGIVLGAAWLLVAAALAGAVNAFTSTCWTLAYRRFDLEPQPVPNGRALPPQPA
jgi:hypothetical protein